MCFNFSFRSPLTLAGPSIPSKGFESDKPRVGTRVKLETHWTSAQDSKHDATSAHVSRWTVHSVVDLYYKVHTGKVLCTRCLYKVHRSLHVQRVSVYVGRALIRYLSRIGGHVHSKA